MRKSQLAITGLVVGGAVLIGGPVMANSPSSSASCSAQLNQGLTPNGLAQEDPGFHGQFTSETAGSAPGAQGQGTSAAAHQHGDLFSCLP